MLAMREMILVISLVAVRIAAFEANLCSGSSEACPRNEADDAAFIQTKIHTIERKSHTYRLSLLEETQRHHEETQREKMKFFSKLIKELGLPEHAIAAHLQFRDFLGTNPRQYDVTQNANVTEYARRLMTFAQTLKDIDARNANEAATNTHPDRAVHGVTKYADWTKDEFSALLGHRSRNGGGLLHMASRAASNSTAAPCTVEWSSRTSMRNQGTCGSCWAFSTATTLRAAYIQQHGVDPGNLSTQFIVDCMNRTTCSDGVNGCCGGNAGAAMEWITQQGGIPTYADYGDYDLPSFLETGTGLEATGGPMSSSNGLTYSGHHPMTPYACKIGIKKTVTMLAPPVQMHTESEMANYVCNTGVMAIAVDASQWNTYKNGVMGPSCGTNTDHAVELVGVNAANNAWIVQNHWGADWGVALDGSPAPKDQYANCESLSSGNGCHDPENPWIATSCALSCSKSVADGGYVFFKFGENTCGVTGEALAATSTAPAGTPPAPAPPWWAPFAAPSPSSGSYSS